MTASDGDVGDTSQQPLGRRGAWLLMPGRVVCGLSIPAWATLCALATLWTAARYSWSERHSPERTMGSYGAFRYEIHGKVQGVFFRKHTHQTAKGLGLVGWVMNTPQGTVVGEAQGLSSELAKLKTWLEKTGSPKSKIQKAVFTEQRSGLAKGDLTFTSFDIRK